MQKTFYLLFILLISFGLSKAQTGATADAFEIQTRVYKAALKNYDIPTAINALYNMQAMKPERTDLKDSMAILYFAAERYTQAYVIAEEIVKNDPKRKDMLELVAVSKQNLGMIKESLSDYEQLYAIDKSIFYLYQMATEQYQLKRYGECVASLDQIIANAESDKQKVNIRTQGGGQQVVMKAAAYNVRGICAVDMGQKDAAKENFTKAIQIDADFALAKANLESLDKEESTSAPKTTTAPKTQPKPAAH